MSMLDSFFKQRFNAAKCKTLLKLTIPRIKLLRNRREIQIKQMRKDIAKLLETGQEATARIRVEHIIREEKMMAAQEIVELFCELIAVRLPIIEAQRECPLDLKEAISSVCFAAPRCADLPELIQVQMLFAGKYGKEFVAAATELMPECGVNRQIVELLSIRAPPPDVKLKLLKEIAEEHELDWDPSATEKWVNAVCQCRLGHPRFSRSSKQQVQPNKGSVSAPEMLHFPEVDDQEEPYPSQGKNISHLEPDNVVPEKIVTKEDEQFVPFISPPSRSPVSFPVREHSSPPSISKTKTDNVDLQDVLAAAQAAAESAERAASAARSAASIAQLRISELVKKKNDHVSDVVDKTGLEKQKSIGDSDSASTSPNQSDGCEKYVVTHQPTAHPMGYGPGLAVDSSSPGGIVDGPSTCHHQPQRLPSMDDETYFSYPNLFTSQGSNQQSFTDSK
ncbi:hypothetical protein DH2020_007727 [Rehmannia glutinosa]|uniref:IST1-like protein n=1 Tax=Rehmannia glutinosa TaxID=99300 RepID=A0ABR0TYY0_REHGL